MSDSFAGCKCGDCSVCNCFLSGYEIHKTELGGWGIFANGSDEAFSSHSSYGKAENALTKRSNADAKPL